MRANAGLSLVALILFCTESAVAQAPTLTAVSPTTTDDSFIIDNPLPVTLTGTGFVSTLTIEFDKPNIIEVSDVDVSSATSATASFRLLTSPDATPDSIGVRVNNGHGVFSPYQKFSIVTKTDVCIEAVQGGGCKLRWEIEATGLTGNNGQTNNRTTPNILVTLDYLVKPPANNRVHQQLVASQNEAAKNATEHTAAARTAARKEAKTTFLGANPNLKVSGSWTDYLTGRLDFKAGFSQVVTSNKVQPATASTTTCPNNTSISGTTCTVAVPQNAFISEMGGKLGWTWGVDGQGTYADVGFGAKGSFSYLVSQNQILQNNGLTYVDLSSLNPKDVVGFYEATGHFRLGQFGHDKTNSAGQAHNTSSLLLIEGGYRNDRGLQQLLANSPQTNTRNRYVGRFYLYPELPNSKHTKIAIGMEYSGGINGGPHVVQIFFGTNLNPSKLFSNSN